MNISEFQIYDLAESIIASGFPMKTEYDLLKFAYECADLMECLTNDLVGVDESSDFQRAERLADNQAGSGHCNFLSGILVSANVTATVKWWEQFQRYHFKQIVSSQSTMHRLRNMISENTISFNGKTNSSVINAFLSIARNENVTDEELAYSCPMGLELTARITTNYLQLKTMFNQRKNHKLQEWRDFCDWITKLPYANELIICKKGNEQ